MLRPLSTLLPPFGAADLLAWHPLAVNSLMVGSSAGGFAFMDASNPTTTDTYQVRLC